MSNQWEPISAMVRGGPAHLLDHGIEAEVMTDAVSQFFVGGEGDEFLGLVDRCGERLFAENVLARLQRLFCHGEMLGGGSADVDGVGLWVGEDVVVVGGDCRNGEAFG